AVMIRWTIERGLLAVLVNGKRKTHTRYGSIDAIGKWQIENRQSNIAEVLDVRRAEKKGDNGSEIMTENSGGKPYRSCRRFGKSSQEFRQWRARFLAKCVRVISSWTIRSETE